MLGHFGPLVSWKRDVLHEAAVEGVVFCRPVAHPRNTVVPPGLSCIDCAVGRAPAAEDQLANRVRVITARYISSTQRSSGNPPADASLRRAGSSLLGGKPLAGSRSPACRNTARNVLVRLSLASRELAPRQPGQGCGRGHHGTPPRVIAKHQRGRRRGSTPHARLSQQGQECLASFCARDREVGMYGDPVRPAGFGL